MEKQELNIAEILKDKPKGIKLWSPLFGNVTLKDADMPHGVLPILTKTELEDIQIFTKEGHFFSTYKDVECMLFPSKKMRDWEKFAWKKGDVLKAGVDNLCIFDSWESDNYTEFHAKFATPNYSGALLKTKEWTKETNEDIIKQYISNIEDIKGGKLNLSTLEIEKKQIVDLPKEEKKCEFKPMDWCLMRMSYSRWNLCQYAYYRKDIDMFVSVGGNTWKECIPYNDSTKHLLGTTDDYVECK